MATSSPAQVEPVPRLGANVGSGHGPGPVSGFIHAPPTKRLRLRALPAVLPALRRALEFWHLTSLDAPTVAVVWALAFARMERVSLPLWLPMGLALCAWSVYVGDRLLDAYRAMRACEGRFGVSAVNPGARSVLHGQVDELRARHYFHWRHRRLLLPLAVVSAVAAIGMALRFMPLAAGERNSVLAVAALVYLICVHSPWRFAGARIKAPKELLVGILFTIACVIPTWARVPAPQDRLMLMPSLLLFIALAWLNCDAIERWESGLSPRPTFRLAVALGAVALVAAAVLYTVSASRLYPVSALRAAALPAAAALAAMLTALLDAKARQMRPTTLRAAADLVLLAPGLLLFLL